MATLIIDRSSSHCGDCGGNASPHDSAHIHGGPKSGYSQGSSLDCENGCGVRFDAVQTGYYDGGREPAVLREARARIEGR